MLNSNLSAGALALVVALALAPGIAAAAEVTGTARVTLDVQPQCTMTTRDYSNFLGAEDSSDGLVAEMGSYGFGVEVSCNSGTPYEVLVNRGQNDGAHSNFPSMRALVSSTNPDDVLAYELFQGADSTGPLWGGQDGEGVHGIGNGEQQNVAGYLVFKGLNKVASGNYSDILTFTNRF